MYAQMVASKHYTPINSSKTFSLIFKLLKFGTLNFFPNFVYYCPDIKMIVIFTLIKVDP